MENIKLELAGAYTYSAVEWVETKNGYTRVNAIFVNS